MKLSLRTVFKRLLKAGCVTAALLSVTLLSACDLIGSFISSDKTEDKVTISRETAVIEVGEELALAAVSSEGRAIYWTSSDEEIATVEEGVVTGVSAGETTVTASDGKKLASCEITVIPAAAVTISHEEATIAEGVSLTLTAVSAQGGEITWSSSDEEIATVEDGVVTGVKAGTATITADDGNATATCEITVIAIIPDEPEIKVTISRTSAEIEAGGQIKLTATASDGSKINWSSSDASIAKVDSVNGTVTGVKAGTAVITAASGTATATCKVTVKAYEPPAGQIDPASPATDPLGRTLVWSDEFNGASLNTNKWGYQIGIQDDYYGNKGPAYWGNGELQYYTDGANVSFADGALRITAKREQMGDRPFTSARITTRDKFSRTFGYFEARMKTPAIEGMWPAFWMLPQPPNHSSSNNEYGGWPANGEIDIMEAKGRLLNKVDCTIHFGGPDWNIHDMAGKGDNVLSSNTDQWHTYAVDWRADYIAWIIDGIEVKRELKSRWWTSAVEENATSSAPFDKPFFILLNLAVGGQYDGYRNPPDDFTQATMYVDYVRVYA